MSGKGNAWKFTPARAFMVGFRPVPYTIRTGRETEGGGRGQRRGCRPISESANSANQQALRRSAYGFAVPFSPGTIGALLHVLYIL